LSAQATEDAVNALCKLYKIHKYMSKEERIYFARFILFLSSYIGTGMDVLMEQGIDFWSALKYIFVRTFSQAVFEDIFDIMFEWNEERRRLMRGKR